MGNEPDERNRKEFLECNDTDYAHEIPGVARFRVNIFKDRKGIGGVFRTIPTKILTAEQLGLPPAILNLCNLSKGLVLVTTPVSRRISAVSSRAYCPGKRRSRSRTSRPWRWAACGSVRSVRCAITVASMKRSQAFSSPSSQSRSSITLSKGFCAIRQA